ncbi:terminase small subunit [Staphylococcus hyicus]|uniref:Terminase small subunit n=1 Tax=Staphylococcus hyicus TaxID=1284 RepID=A0ACD5FL96_STAHY|nr:terminase small subunit [Staphylococcus hyicus]MDP4462887.1 terminase small subunit [Staphylococcus hyicus]
MKLTEKQKKFADEYIISGNATKAAIKAGYSEKSARFVGAENLTKPNISNYIKERIQKATDERLMGVTEALELSAAIARGEKHEAYSKYYDHLKGEVIKEMTYTVTPTFEERQRSLEHILKVHGAFNQGLNNKKIETEIKMLEKKIEQIDKGDAGTEDKIRQLHYAITDVISNE